MACADGVREKEKRECDHKVKSAAKSRIRCRQETARALRSSRLTGYHLSATIFT